MHLKIQIFILLTIFGFKVKSQTVIINVTQQPPPGTVTGDTVYYSLQRKLSWDDFRGKVYSSSSFEANTFTGFSYNSAVLEKKDTLFVHIFLQIYFDRKGSWVRPGSRNAYALSHEQLHFDIAKLVADQFRDTLLSGTFSKDHESEIYALYWDYWRKLTKMELQFDEETKHGRNHAAEAVWERKIGKALKIGAKKK